MGEVLNSNNADIEKLLIDMANRIKTINSTDFVVEMPSRNIGIKPIRKKRNISKVKNNNKSFRYTEPKKRNFFKRMILQRKLNQDMYEEIEDDIYQNRIIKKELDRKKYSETSKDRRYYKKVQEYEDARDDTSIRKEIIAFKVALATAAIAGTIALTNFVGSQVKEVLNTEILYKTVAAATYNETTPEEKIEILNNALEFANKVKENDGYYFDNLSNEELAEGYYKIMNYERKMDKYIFEGAFSKIVENKDQTLLEDIVEKSFKEDFESLTEEQKKDYKQLAFELLPYSLPDVFKDGNNYLRNPIVFESLTAKNASKEKGYKISLIVNSDEKETVRNLGNIQHILNNFSESDYANLDLTDNGQKEFFENILKEVIGEDFDKLTKTQKRDYSQIIYEWLPLEGKNYIKDPLESEDFIMGMKLGDQDERV